MPTGDPWLKAVKPRTSRDVRLHMVELAVESNPFFRASDIEVRRPGPTYTVDTLQKLAEDLGSDTELFFLLGMDSLAEFPKWRSPERVVQLCTPVVFRRPSASDGAPEAAIRKVPSLRRKLIVLDAPVFEVSSSEIRRRVAEGRSVRYLVPDAVERFISEQGLYLEPN